MHLRPFAFAPVASLLLLFAAGCGANVFPVEVKGETTIPGDPSPLPGLLNAFPNIGSFSNIDFNQSQEFQNQGVTKDQVDSVKMDQVELRIVSPETQDFSFLENLQFYARAADQEVLVAEKFGIDKLDLKAPNPVLVLDVKKDVELAPYITAEKTSIIVRGKGKQPPQETRLEATVRVNVAVKVF